MQTMSWFRILVIISKPFLIRYNYETKYSINKKIMENKTNKLIAAQYQLFTISDNGERTLVEETTYEVGNEPIPATSYRQPALICRTVFVN